MRDIKPITREERMAIARKMEAKTPLTWEECDRLLDHIEYLETGVQSLANAVSKS